MPTNAQKAQMPTGGGHLEAFLSMALRSQMPTFPLSTRAREAFLGASPFLHGGHLNGMGTSATNVAAFWAGLAGEGFDYGIGTGAVVTVSGTAFQKVNSFGE